METTERICAHGLCNCIVTDDSDYCSPYCAQVGLTTNDTPDENHKVICDCGHPTCVG